MQKPPYDGTKLANDIVFMVYWMNIDPQQAVNVIRLLGSGDELSRRLAEQKTREEKKPCGNIGQSLKK